MLGNLEGMENITPSLSDREVAPMRQAHVWRASQSWYDAFVDDPVINYGRAGEEPSPRANKAVIIALLSLWIRDKMVLTIDKGSALVVATPVKSGHKNPVNRLTTLLSTWILSFLGRLGTPEQKKRNREFRTKVEKLISEVLGDRIKHMMYVDLLATQPQSQGHGYGGALLDTVTRLADAQGRATYLVSSNILNFEFYNSHGFETVGEVYLGNDNPRWHQEPITVQLMVREPAKPLLSKKY